MGSEHTKEPWRISEGHDFSYLAIVADVAIPIAHISNWLLSEQMRANAARICACVNLLANHDPAQVVVMGRSEMAKVRFALQSAILLARITDRDDARECYQEAMALLPAEEVRT